MAGLAWRGHLHLVPARREVFLAATLRSEVLKGTNGKVKGASDSRRKIEFAIRGATGFY
jgi:hypothetical protein